MNPVNHAKLAAALAVLGLGLVAAPARPARADSYYCPGAGNNVMTWVTIDTDGRDDAGTDARVFVTLHGTWGSLPEIEMNRQVGRSPDLNPFERNDRNTFWAQICVPDTGIGPLTRLRVRHDGSGRKPGWFLNKVTVYRSFWSWERLTRGETYTFPAYRWLASDEADGRIWADFYPSRY